MHTYIWLVCGSSVRIKEQTPQRHISKRDWTTTSNFINYSALNSEHTELGGPNVFSSRINNHALSDNHN